MPDSHARGTQGKTLRRDKVRPDCHARGTQGTGQDSLGTESLYGIGEHSMKESLVEQNLDIEIGKDGIS